MFGLESRYYLIVSPVHQMLNYVKFVKKRVQDIYQKTSKHFSCMLSVSFPKYVEHVLVELISDLQILRTTHMVPVMTDSRSVPEIRC